MKPTQPRSPSPTPDEEATSSLLPTTTTTISERSPTPDEGAPLLPPNRNIIIDFGQSGGAANPPKSGDKQTNRSTNRSKRWENFLKAWGGDKTFPARSITAAVLFCGLLASTIWLVVDPSIYYYYSIGILLYTIVSSPLFGTVFLDSNSTGSDFNIRKPHTTLAIILRLALIAFSTFSFILPFTNIGPGNDELPIMISMLSVIISAGIYFTSIDFVKINDLWKRLVNTILPIRDDKSSTLPLPTILYFISHFISGSTVVAGVVDTLMSYSRKYILPSNDSGMSSVVVSNDDPQQGGGLSLLDIFRMFFPALCIAPMQCLAAIGHKLYSYRPLASPLAPLLLNVDDVSTHKNSDESEIHKDSDESEIHKDSYDDEDSNKVAPI